MAEAQTDKSDIIAEGRFVCHNQRDLGETHIQVSSTRLDGVPAVNIQITTDGAITSVTLAEDETTELIGQLEDLVYDQADLIE